MPRHRYKKHTRSLLWLIRDLIGHEQRLAAEVGVFRGENSKALLQEFPGLTLSLVDPWREWPEGSEYRKVHTCGRMAEQVCGTAGCKGMGALSQDQWDLVAAEAMSNCHGHRHKVYRMDSGEAAALHEDGSLDFVFIDADHTYEGVRGDIELWTPKVRVGGLVSGHDYRLSGAKSSFWGVNKAVDEAFGTSDVEHRPGMVWGYVKR